MRSNHNKTNANQNLTFHKHKYKGWASEANRSKAANVRKNLAGVFQSNIV